MKIGTFVTILGLFLVISFLFNPNLFPGSKSNEEDDFFLEFIGNVFTFIVFVFVAF